MNLHPTICRRKFQAISTSLLLLVLPDWGFCDERVVSQDDQQLRSANNEFAVSLLKQLDEQKAGQNHVISAFSIESALLMTLQGAAGQTAEQMRQTLKLPANPARLNTTEGRDMVGILPPWKHSCGDFSQSIQQQQICGGNS